LNSKFIKIYYGIAGSFAGLAIIYYLARLVDLLINDNDISGTVFAKLNTVAIIFLAVALLMLIVGVFMMQRVEKKTTNIPVANQKDQELLAKYKSKKK
jgi:membrane protein insertase Oxa1/YidC/SpoIIIJ